MIFNTTGLSNMYFALHNKDMLDPSPKGGHGTAFELMKLQKASEALDETGKREINLRMLVFTKTLINRLPDKPWSNLKCRKNGEKVTKLFVA